MSTDMTHKQFFSSASNYTATFLGHFTDTRVAVYIFQRHRNQLFKNN